MTALSDRVPGRSFAAVLTRLLDGRDAIAEDHRHQARRALLNVLGVVLGVDEIGTCDIVAAAAAPGTVTVPGRRERVDRYWAARLTAVCAHVDDFDDTHLATVIHPTAAVFGALVGHGYADADSDRFLAAVVLGIESQLRLGLAITPWHYARGWHITGTCGPVGAAVGVGVLDKWSAPRIVASTGLAARMYVGHREGFGSMVKALNAGQAAANGLLAHDLTRVDGTADAVEAPGGFVDLLSGEIDDRWFDPDHLGHWPLLDNSYKPYPCGVVAHPAIEAAVALHARFAPGGDFAGLVDEIERIDVHCHPLVPDLMGKAAPANGLEGRFSAIHGVAVGLLDGRAGLPQFSDARVRATDVAAMRDRIRLRPEPDCGRDAVVLKFYLRDGRVGQSRVEHVASSIERPLTDVQVEQKVRELVEPRLGAPTADELTAIVWGLGRGKEPGDLARFLDGLAPRPVTAASEAPPRPHEGARTASATLAAQVVAAGASGPTVESARRVVAAVTAISDHTAGGNGASAPENRAFATARALAVLVQPGTDAAAVAVCVAALTAAAGRDDDAVAGIVAGLHALRRLQDALGLADDSPWVVAGAFATPAAALAAARAAGLDAVCTLAALGSASTMLSGLAVAAEGDAVGLQPAKAAHDALVAVRLAERGMDGPAAPVEGVRGIAAVVAGGHCDHDRLDLGHCDDDWVIAQLDQVAAAIPSREVR